MIKNKYGMNFAFFGEGKESFFIFIKGVNSTRGYSPDNFLRTYEKNLPLKMKLIIKFRSLFY